MKLYHVCANYDGGDLMTAARMMGELEAIESYVAKWPEAGELAAAHVNMIHLHETIDQAREFAAIYGGAVLEIDAEYLDVVVDSLEYPHPVCTSTIDAEYITMMVA